MKWYEVFNWTWSGRHMPGSVTVHVPRGVNMLILSANYVQIFVMPARKNATSTMWIIAKDVHRSVFPARKNAQ